MALRTLSVFLALTTTTFGVLFVRADRAQSDAEGTHIQSSAVPLILQEGDGERRIRRPGSGSVSEFFIKIDKQNGNAEDFYVGAEVMNPGAMIPFHTHHNSEEVVIMEEGGATVTVGDKRAVTGPHALAIRCPLCGWSPRKEDKWFCTCGNEWNTFDTGGVWPTCLHQWTETRCLSCSRWSPHSLWYSQ
jgi:mannose-6-phosphate isomerase-like protein (cupin superfamily)